MVERFPWTGKQPPHEPGTEFILFAPCTNDNPLSLTRPRNRANE